MILTSRNSVMNESLLNESKMMSADSEEDSKLVDQSVYISNSEDKPSDDEAVGDEAPNKQDGGDKKNASFFPYKLFQILSSEEHEDIVTWLPDGKSFKILRQEDFVTEILGVHFKNVKYSSFTRKLRRWGFKRHLRGEKTGAFFHKNFQRDRTDLLEKMTCYNPNPPRTSTSHLDHPASSASAAAAACFPGARALASPSMTSLNLRSPAPHAISQLGSHSPVLLQQRASSLPSSQAETLRTPSIHNMVTPTPLNALQPAASAGATSSLSRLQHRGEDAWRQDLNTVIELEVVRRLRERHRLTRLTRQALENTESMQAMENMWKFRSTSFPPYNRR